MLADETLSPARVDDWHLLASDSARFNKEIVNRKSVLSIGRCVKGDSELEQLANRDGGGNKVVGVRVDGFSETVGNRLAH